MGRNFDYKIKFGGVIRDFLINYVYENGSFVVSVTDFAFKVDGFIFNKQALVFLESFWEDDGFYSVGFVFYGDEGHLRVVFSGSDDFDFGNDSGGFDIGIGFLLEDSTYFVQV